MAELNFTDSKIMEKINELSKIAEQSTIIDSSYYEKYDVKRGLRDLNGLGIVAGLTEISEIQGNKEPMEGELYYRGINIKDLVNGFTKEDRFGFEETVYLLLFGNLPNKEELDYFNQILADFRKLPLNFVRDVIMKRPSFDMMNTLAKSVLTLYSYDDNPDDISISNILRQGLQLIAQFPLLTIYGYQVFSHYHNDKSLIIHKPRKDLSTAENILLLLRQDKEYTKLEAKLLDICLVLHAEHGGGNNSTFTTHVVSSSGTDTYSSVAASLGALKGPKHGGANIKVVRMFEDMKNNLKTYSDLEIRNYLLQLLNKEAFDKSGLIYGMGHAVYSLSDPRAVIFKKFVKNLAVEKGLDREYELYEKVERLAPEVIAEKRRIYKGVSPNVDFYSGFVYTMLGLPQELYTPIFAVARIGGWIAHRIEEIANRGKIIRPGYTSVCPRQKYIPLEKR
ncbi:MAG: citrate/2-methylcitrate synthase [Bacillota bacterium]|jgi:citrate synthase|nr:citrate/2-methylcitrate synthase [Bacillota bacterium]HHU43473.1 citrate/2-methylcitrate synthase [Clostridiales bacterium]